MLLARTTTQFVETALLVGTHLPLVCQKNLVASFARKENLVKKVATLHQLRDARTAIRANTEERIRNPHHARIVSKAFIKTLRDRHLAWLAALGSLSPTRDQSNVMYVLQEGT